MQSKTFSSYSGSHDTSAGFCIRNLHAAREGTRSLQNAEDKPMAEWKKPMESRSIIVAIDLIHSISQVGTS